MANRNDATHVDFIELTKFDSNPITSPESGDRFIAVVSAELKFWNGSSWTALSTGGGGGGTPSWETIFSNDNTFTIASGQFTIAGELANATDVVTFTADGSASGDVIKIQNSGSGADISGTSDTWTISKAGAATFAGFTPGGDITSTSTAIDWDLIDNNASALSFDTAGVAGMLEFDTTNGSEVLKTAAGTFQVTQGLAELIQASNTVSALRVTDNTATTFGADANSAGVAVFRSTSLTSGSLVQLQLTEGTLNGGFYLTARDVTGSANVFTVGEDGATTIAGAAGNTVFTITAGDVVVSDGSVAITDADNAESVTIINNTATTIGAAASAGVVQLESTSLTTGALLNLQLTEGTLNGGSYVRAWDATGGAEVFSVGENGLTTIAGSASGTDALVVTAGDVLIDDGALQVDGAVTVGVDDTGFDVKFFGATASKFVVWDQSADDLILADGVALQLGGDESTADGFKVEFDGTSSLDIDALTANDAVTIGSNTNTDFILHTTSGAAFTVDASADTITVAGGVPITLTGSAALTAALTLTAGDLVVTDGLVQVSTNAGVTADAGSAQGGEPITNTYTEISTVGTGGDSVTLPAAAAGRLVIVTNHGANAADVFPASGDAINEGSADAATSVAVNETLLCIAYDATNWEVVQLARNS